jgi:aspartyl-tRNA(Asn)/glutamyl-tRNA(Gln) amidotransferase subunit A
MADELHWLSAREMTRRFARGDLSPVDVLDATLAKLNEVNPALNAVCLLDEPLGERLAAESAERWRRGAPIGPLDGVPVAIKDTAHVAGWPTRIGSHATPTAPATEDTPGIARLREAGALFFCKTTTPEFGWKGITHGPLTGVTRNPWDTSRTPGGSSGGSAALVAAGVVPLATGGDGGGSIRIPAAFSGVFGLKASYGVVPNFLGPMGPLAVYGGLSRDVADSALLMNVLTRPDARDSFAIPYRGIDYLDGLESGVSELKIAWSPDLGFPVADPAVIAAMQPAIDALISAGADVKEVDLDLSGAHPTLEVIWGASHAALVRDFDSEKLAALDPGLLRLVVSAQDISASELQAAYADMRALSQTMHAFHREYDLLLTPTVPITAFAAGIDTPDATRFPQWYDWTPLTWPFNLTRQPAASVLCGFVEGLPIGLQIVGPMFSEEIILRASRCVEQACATGARPDL